MDDGQEVTWWTNPNSSDTDGDGVSDPDDIFPSDSGETIDNDADGIWNNSDPDDDNDGLDDKKEEKLWTNPYIWDTDNDGINDAMEYKWWTNPNASDTDGDGINDGKEIEINTNPNASDTDGDGLDDYKELQTGTDPKKIDTDEDGLADGIDMITNYRVVLSPYIPRVVFPYKSYRYSIWNSYDTDWEITKIEWRIGGEVFSWKHVDYEFDEYLPVAIEDVMVSVYDDKQEKSEQSYKILFLHPFMWGIILIFLLLVIYIIRKIFVTHKKNK